MTSGSTRGPNISRSTIPASTFTMSSWVNTAIARACTTPADSKRLAQRPVPKITGTSRSAADDRKRFVLVQLDDRDVVSGGGQVRDDAAAERAQSDDDDVFAQVAHPPEAGGMGKALG